MSESINCFKCYRPIERLDESGDCPPEVAAWDGGMVDKMCAGYGSQFDTKEFVVGLCDRCIKEHLEGGRDAYSRPDLEAVSPSRLFYLAQKIVHPDGAMFGDTDRAVTDMIRWLSNEFGDLRLEYLNGIGWRVLCCLWDKDVGASGENELTLFQSLAIACIVLHEERHKLIEANQP